MWILKLSLTTLWMAGMVAGWTLGGVLHLLAVAVVALVLVEETPIERRLAEFRFATPGSRRARTGRAVHAWAKR